MFEGYYSNVKTNESYIDQTNRATYTGITIKSLILLAIVVVTAFLTGYFLPKLLVQQAFYFMLIGAAVVGTVTAIVGRLSERAAMICSFIYSLCEGLLLGTVTAIVNSYFPSAGTLAVAATMVVFTIMLVLYAFGFIRNGSLIRMILFGLLFSILALSVFNLVFYLVSGTAFIISYILIQGALMLYGVFMLSLMFNQAEAVVKLGASKNAEWCVALGIEVALIYIYIYALRFISLISRRS